MLRTALAALFLFTQSGLFATGPSVRKAEVIVFLSPECPLCQSYSATLRRLHERFGSAFLFKGIVPGTEYSNADIQAFRRRYKIPFEIVADPTNTAVMKYRASVTPEVFVANAAGRIIYSGRIDNWAYEVGRKRKVITSHDLENVLLAVSAGKPIVPTHTKAIGCFIE